MNDNRDYKYEVKSKTHRDEYHIIEGWITRGSRVIDLGCGDGSLLQLLQNKEVSGEGIEISRSAVKSCLKKELKVKQGRIDIPLSFKNKEFDFAICNVTIQMVMYPEVLISEMKRISKMQIISFPNFAFILNRLDLLLYGRMPRVMIPGYSWYSTGHIHQFSIKDFMDFCKLHNLKITKSHFLVPRKINFFPQALIRPLSNIISTTVIFLTK